MRRHDDKAEVKEALKDRIADLCRRLLPDGRIDGRLWVADNPVMPDPRKMPAFKVALDGDKGAWKDWRSGDKGDVLSLISYTQGLDFPGTMAWARDFLGFQTMSFDQRRALSRQAEEAAVRSKIEAEKRERMAIEAGARMFLDAAETTKPGQRGRPTLAFDAAGAVARHAGAYLLSRGIDLACVPQLDRESFRFSAASEYWALAEYRRDDRRRVKIRNGPEFPAIHSAMRGPTGIVTACHLTFLHPTMAAKAPLPASHKPRLIRGRAGGAVIRLTHGPEGLPPEQASRPFPLIICEGIETGLSLALAIPEARVWAAGSLGNMGDVPIGFDFVSAVFVAGDNDWASPQAQAELDKGLAKLARHGKPVALMQSHEAGDFNDLIQEDT